MKIELYNLTIQDKPRKYNSFHNSPKYLTLRAVTSGRTGGGLSPTTSISSRSPRVAANAWPPLAPLWCWT